MIKVKIIFKDSQVEEFFAHDSYSDVAEGRLVFWNTDKGDTISYPTKNIKKIIETWIDE